LWLVVDADIARNTEMIGYTQYSLQSQTNLDFKWTKLDLQVHYSFCVFLELFISPECDGIQWRKSKTVPQMSTKVAVAIGFRSKGQRSRSDAKLCCTN